MHKSHTQSTLIHAGCTQTHTSNQVKSLLYIVSKQYQYSSHVSRGAAHLVLTRGFAVSVCCRSRDGANATWRERCMEMCREARAMGRTAPAPLWAPEQQHLLTGWSAKRLAFLQQQGQWGGMRRHCHNQMQASWPSPRKGRHLLHLPKALFSKPQRTKCQGGEQMRTHCGGRSTLKHR